MNDKTNKIYTFIWQGIDKHGMKIKGELDAHDTQSAKHALRNSGTTPLSIRKKSASFFFNIKNKINHQDITSFSKELSNLISAHIPLAKALEITATNTNKPTLKNIIANIRVQVNSGKSLSDAFRKFPDYFDDIFCSLIEAGEHSGTLHIMLSSIIEHQEKSNKLKRSIKKALLYPIIVLVISLIVTTALLVFIVPQFADLFNNVGAELPVLTKIIIRLSDSIYGNLKIITTALLFIFFSIKISLKRSEKMSILLDSTALKIPLFGNILKQSIFARSFHTLSVLLTTGVPITEALHLTAKISGNKIYYKAFSDISQRIIAGNSIHQSIRETNKFPHKVTQMISIGEASGTLENMLKNIGDYFEERTNDIVYNLSQLIEPAIMIILCIIIGTVVIAMYLPIFKIGTVI